MTITNAPGNLAILLETTSIAKAHAYPVESLGTSFPCAVLEYTDGTLEMESAGDLSRDVMTLRVLVLFPRKQLRTAATKIRPLITEVRNLIWANASLTGACVAVESIEVAGPGETVYNDTMYYGVRFDLGILFKENVTFAV